ncbi:bifunctional 4-hydroxy-2-oxoglutarate aldolase/2-dehydro-3-deoxy-phosphogluconate aldolase [Marinobacter sp. X15-166B]|uniref:bifunctional 4-hydroxy-2-oxoglutarate aldolase/2-dehydro-3-deoxy-phosphogluconate aldolase n=1 Tax=Marinobacter sp. X15-166B TaxID=1897620 RepID=UPI00085C70E7|nr:bifunctional 4-hydroxy-2-oxoglutarate aldolase/2-dehydro-3-deoxy-phosphogluconate aldolase [Marinobacter sp. X15-166B]OEY67174.1 keto-deoxy-phosphogluconate aldolase [Marinobacter sp. X15-166B]
MVTMTDAHQRCLRDLLAAGPLIPVIAVQDPAHALPLCRALVAGGIRILEITLRTPHGLQAIERVRKALPDVWVGAGTVTTVEQYRQVERAGAQFAISPGLTESLLEHGLGSTVALLPGVATASEVMLGYARGLRVFKLFPAEVAGGIPALKAFLGPFPDVTFCPTGGIRQDTARAYLELPNVAAVGGTWMLPRDRVEAEDWASITRIAADSLALLG